MAAMAGRSDVIRAIELALAGHWAEAHEIVQGLEGEREADHLHAILHKIEGDEANARYWYRRAGQFYESFADPEAELAALSATLTY